MDDSPYDPAHLPAPASYHWTPHLQREFLEAFATNGSVKISAAKVGMSPSAVYQLRQRAEGAAFHLGCVAAVLIARARLADELLDPVICIRSPPANNRPRRGKITGNTMPYTAPITPKPPRLLTFARKYSI